MEEWTRWLNARDTGNRRKGRDQRSGRDWAVWALAAVSLGAGALWQLTAPNGDLYQYRCFALAFWRGSAGVPHAAGCAGRLPAGAYPAFHVLPREYPPLAIIPFSAPLLFGGLVNLTLYVIAFNILMAFCLGATAWLIGRIGVWLRVPNARTTQALYLLWLALGATTIALVRFDALPALLTVAALALAMRPTGASMALPWARYTAYALLAVGALLKLYPALFIPLLAAWDWRRELAGSGVVETAATGRNAGSDANAANAERRASQETSGTERRAGLESGGTMAAIARRWMWLGGPLLAGVIAVVGQGVANLIAGGSGVNWLSVQGQRPPQIESTAAGLLWLWQVAIGQGDHIHAVSVQRSASFVEEPGRALATATLALALLAIAWAFVAIAAGALAPLRTIAGATLALLGGAAIFSPQYLVWAIPLVALALLAPTPASARDALGLAHAITPALAPDVEPATTLATTPTGASATSADVTHRDWLTHLPRRDLLLALLWTAVCVCTTIIYSVGYLLGWPAHTGGVLAGFMLLVLARDGLVWACAALLLWPGIRWARQVGHFTPHLTKWHS